MKFLTNIKEFFRLYQSFSRLPNSVQLLIKQETIFGTQTKGELKSIPLPLLYALTQVGLEEYTEPGMSNPEIEKYFNSVDLGTPVLDDIAWCAAFINWCLDKGSIIGTGHALAKSFLTWGEEVTGKPNLGDIVVLKRGTSEWQGHVAFYLDHSSGMYRLLGGNQLNRVGVNAYPKEQVISIRRYQR